MLEHVAPAILFRRQTMPLLQDERVHSQVLQRLFGCLASHLEGNPLGPLQSQIHPQLAATLGGNVDRVIGLLEELADDPLAHASAIHVGGVQKVHAGIRRPLENRHGVVLGNLSPVGAAELPRAQTDLGDLNPRSSQLAVFHDLCPPSRLSRRNLAEWTLVRPEWTEVRSTRKPRSPSGTGVSYVVQRTRCRMPAKATWRGLRPEFSEWHREAKRN